MLFPSWFFKELKKLQFLKKKTHAKFKVSSNIYKCRKFLLFRTRFKYETRKYLRNYTLRAKILKNNPRDYWKFISNTRLNNDIP